MNKNKERRQSAVRPFSVLITNVTWEWDAELSSPVGQLRDREGHDNSRHVVKRGGVMREHENE